MDTWDTAELDSRLAAAEGRAPSPLPDWIASYRGKAGRPKLLQLPDPAAPRTRVRPRHVWLDASTGADTPSAPSAAWFAEVRRARRERLVTVDEARALLGLPPLPTSRRLARRLRRVLRTLRRVRWL